MVVDSSRGCLRTQEGFHSASLVSERLLSQGGSAEPAGNFGKQRNYYLSLQDVSKIIIHWFWDKEPPTVPDGIFPVELLCAQIFSLKSKVDFFDLL